MVYDLKLAASFVGDNVVDVELGAVEDPALPCTTSVPLLTTEVVGFGALDVSLEVEVLVASDVMVTPPSGGLVSLAETSEVTEMRELDTVTAKALEAIEDVMISVPELSQGVTTH
jgi:hypothetical protein